MSPGSTVDATLHREGVEGARGEVLELAPGTPGLDGDDRHNPLVGGSRRGDLFRGRAAAALGHAGAVVSSLAGESGLQGAAVSSPLEWDTGHFGFPCAAVTWVGVAAKDPDLREQMVESLLRPLVQSWLEGGVRHGLAVCAKDDLPALEGFGRVGFRRVLEWLTCWNRNKEDELERARERAGLEVPTSGEAEALAELANREYGEEGRFHLDPIFPRERARAVYSELVRQGCREGRIRVVRMEGVAAGLLYAKELGLESQVLGESVVSNRLYLVERRWRRRGLGGRLLAGMALDGRLHHSGVEAHNAPSVRLHENAGFRWTNRKVALHWTRPG